uniref:Uncharacterized protein n=1 Tax=Opuntia streptacantha TaxID=393608 RepID=A0A7C8YI55_OPUST
MMNSSRSGSSDSNILLGAELLSAAREGCGGDEILRILEGDPTLIHVTDPVGDTTLHIVARAGNLEVANQVVGLVRKYELTEVLMEQNLQGDTPLHVAAANRHKHVTRLLYKAERRAGSLLNEDEASPWGLAAEAGFSLDDFTEFSQGYTSNKVPCIAVLTHIEMDIQYRALLEIPDNDQQHLVLQALREDPDLVTRKLSWRGTLLHIAAERGLVGMLRLVIGQMAPDEAGRLMLEGNDDGDTALHVALEEDHKHTARYLIKREPRAAYQVNREGVSPLCLAVQRGFVDLVQYVFKKMPIANLSLSTRESFLVPKKASLLNAAFTVRNLRILELVIKELPEITDAEGYKGWRILSYFAYKGYLEGVRFLLTNFPHLVKKYDQDGSLPIHKAVGGNRVSIIKEFLLHCPCTLYDVDKKGQSILHFAVKYIKPNVLSYLAGETTEISNIFSLKDNKGKTFIDLANELKISS